MGKRGPRPLPTAVKKQRGTLQKCRTTPNELTTTPGVPARPRGLSPVARAEWTRVVKELGPTGVLALSDGAALEAYCSTFAQARRYQDLADAEPMIDTPYGPKVNPATNAALKSWALVRGYLAEFGLSPAARSRVSMPEQAKPADKSEDFLFGNSPLVLVTGTESK